VTATLHVLRVFVDADGRNGNPLGVFLDGSAIAPDDRPGVAAELGFSETVFVDDARTGRIRIYTPGQELPFAGHPAVGTAWLLADVGMPVDELHLLAGIVPTWTEGDLRWVRARPEWIHPITLAELPSAAAVEALGGPPDGESSWYPWAWRDDSQPLFRRRGGDRGGRGDRRGGGPDHRPA